MLVDDASVIVKLLVDEPGTEAARSAVTARDDCVAPDVLSIEVASALAKKVRFFGLSFADAQTGFDSFPAFVAELTDTHALLRPAIALSIELDHSFFDCLYLALAIERDCQMLSADRKFVAAASTRYASNLVLLR